MLAFATFYSVYKFQKTRFSVPNFKHKQPIISANFIIGCIASSIYFLYTIVVSEDYLTHKLGIYSIYEQISMIILLVIGEDQVLYVYYIVNSIYNGINFHLMYLLIKEQRATSPERFMMNFKMSVFLIKMNLTVICKFFKNQINNYFKIQIS